MLANPIIHKEREETGYKCLNHAQQAFSSALIKADHPVPIDVVGPTCDKKAQKRFSVYRNNVVVSLTEALMAAFPTIVLLVGEDYFRALARLFIGQHPPRSAILATYGDGFDQFLEAFKPLAGLPYLGDIARLERAWNTAYNAADRAPLDPSHLQDIPAEQLPDITFGLHPASQLLKGHHAAYSIWAAHKTDDPTQAMATLTDEPQDILVTRPQWDVIVIALPPGGHAFIDALKQGQPLGQAAAMAQDENDAFDLGQNIGGLLETGALASLHAPPSDF